MILCLDLGNSQLFGGVFDGTHLLFHFRHDMSAQLGTFLKNQLHLHELKIGHIQRVAICSVVPEANETLRRVINNCFAQDPFFLSHTSVGDMILAYDDPTQLGADRIANAIAAVEHYPNQNVIVIDMGTATTFCAITKDKTYLGGAIMSGLRLSRDALANNTSKLPLVEIVKPDGPIGRTTQTGIQAGLYYAQLGAAREIVAQIIKAQFPDEAVIVIGTGGFASLFQDANVFDVIKPDLVLDGLRLAVNQCPSL